MDTNGLFGAFGGITGEKIGSGTFMVEEGPLRGVGLRDRITDDLTSMIDYL